MPVTWIEVYQFAAKIRPDGLRVRYEEKFNAFRSIELCIMSKFRLFNVIQILVHELFYVRGKKLTELGLLYCIRS